MNAIISVNQNSKLFCTFEAEISKTLKTSFSSKMQIKTSKFKIVAERIKISKDAFFLKKKTKTFRT